jgi:hypothetical protein
LSCRRKISYRQGETNRKSNSNQSVVRDRFMNLEMNNITNDDTLDFNGNTNCNPAVNSLVDNNKQNILTEAIIKLRFNEYSLINIQNGKLREAVV